MLRFLSYRLMLGVYSYISDTLKENYPDISDTLKKGVAETDTPAKDFFAGFSPKREYRQFNDTIHAREQIGDFGDHKKSIKTNRTP